MNIGIVKLTKMTKIYREDSSYFEIIHSLTTEQVSELETVFLRLNNPGDWTLKDSYEKWFALLTLTIENSENADRYRLSPTTIPEI